MSDSLLARLQLNGLLQMLVSAHVHLLLLRRKGARTRPFAHSSPQSRSIATTQIVAWKDNGESEGAVRAALVATTGYGFRLIVRGRVKTMAALAGFFSCSTAIDLPVAVADQDLQPGSGSRIRGKHSRH
jgi:hypothetical protein